MIFQFHPSHVEGLRRLWKALPAKSRKKLSGSYGLGDFDALDQAGTLPDTDPLQNYANAVFEVMGYDPNEFDPAIAFEDGLRKMLGRKPGEPTITEVEDEEDQ